MNSANGRVLARLLLVLSVVAGVFVTTLPGLYSVGLLGSAVSFGLLSILGHGRSRLLAALLGTAFLLCAPLTFLPLPLLGAIAVVIDSLTHRTRESLRTSVRKISVVAFLVGAVSIIALILWWRDMEGFLVYAHLPSYAYASNVTLAVFVVGGSIINSVFEEGLWRRFMMDASQGCADWAVRATVLAALFGLVHLHALPGGWMGVAMTAAFGFAASWLVRASGGRILPAVVVHAISDVLLLGLAVGLWNVS